jgi:O-antigen ligase
MSASLAAPPRSAGSGDPPQARRRALTQGPDETRASRLRQSAALAWPALLIAGVLCLVTFIAGAGLILGTMTTVEIALTLGGGVAIAATVVLTPADGPTYGLWPTGLLLAFAALSALSVVWSVQPDASWQDAARLFAYGTVFGLAVVLARAAPRRWPAVLGGVLLASVIVCGYALLTKVFPDRLGGEEIVYYARLREPYGYWNAIGLAAALGAIACMWLGARRAGHGLLSALAYPALGIMLVTVLLAYSRGALAALALGLALWFCLVPLRLRGATVLLTAGLGAGVVIAWDFSRPALTTDHATLAARVTAGHQLGVLLAAVLLALTLAGLAIGFLTSRRPGGGVPIRLRRRVGALLLSLPAIALIALVGLLATSHRGLYGSISHDLGSLTNPNASVPANGPGRLTAVGSARARYWNEALKVFADHPVLGVGAAGYETARLRYRTKPINVAHAHGFVVQTLADLGLVGLLLALALLATWLVAATRPGRAATGPPLGLRWRAWRERRSASGQGSSRSERSSARRRYTPERIGLLTMLCLVVTFGVHSFIDWTWYVPGLSCTALLCAGWLAGRGPLTDGTARAAAEPARPSAAPVDGSSLAHKIGAVSVDPRSLGIAVAVLLAALLAAWAQWQPQRSVDASDAALALVASNPPRALSAARAAVSRDPLSAEALLTLAAVQQGAGEALAARVTLARAVKLQPSNYKTWLALGEYNLHAGRPRAALDAVRAAVYLNPQAIDPRATIAEDGELLALQNAYLQALRAVGQSGGTAAPGSSLPASGSAAGGRAPIK